MSQRSIQIIHPDGTEAETAFKEDTAFAAYLRAMKMNYAMPAAQKYGMLARKICNEVGFGGLAQEIKRAMDKCTKQLTVN